MWLLWHLRALACAIVMVVVGCVYIVDLLVNEMCASVMVVPKAENDCQGGSGRGNGNENMD